MLTAYIIIIKSQGRNDYMIRKIITTLSLAALILTGVASFGEKAEAASYRQKAVSVAKSNLGIKYKWGGMSRRGFDCSGLVKYSYQKAGKKLPRTAKDMYKKGVRVKSLKTGDLLFYVPNKASKPTHVAIYVGKGKIIHSASSRGVSYSTTNNVYWKARYIGAKRI